MKAYEFFKKHFQEMMGLSMDVDAIDSISVEKAWELMDRYSDSQNKEAKEYWGIAVNDVNSLEGEVKELREGLIECVNHLRITVNIFDTPTHDLIKTIDKLLER